jgi:hypothetical protein
MRQEQASGPHRISIQAGEEAVGKGGGVRMEPVGFPLSMVHGNGGKGSGMGP